MSQDSPRADTSRPSEGEGARHRRKLRLTAPRVEEIQYLGGLTRSGDFSPRSENRGGRAEIWVGMVGMVGEKAYSKNGQSTVRGMVCPCGSILAQKQRCASVKVEVVPAYLGGSCTCLHKSPVLKFENLRSSRRYAFTLSHLGITEHERRKFQEAKEAGKEESSLVAQNGLDAQCSHFCASHNMKDI